MRTQTMLHLIALRPKPQQMALRLTATVQTPQPTLPMSPGKTP
jgi:hypothetical protein